jgi:hypothetical protein
MAIDVGSVYRLAFTLKSPDGALVNAGSMALTINLPDGTSTLISPVAPGSTGVYQYDYTTVQSGRHIAHWVGTGANPGAYAEAFEVLSATPPALISLADAKQQLNISTNAFDDELRVFVDAATAAVERHRNESIIRRTFVEEHYLTDYAWGYGQNIGQPAAWGVPARKLSLDKRPALSLTSVARVDGTLSWDVSNLHLNSNGIVSVMFGNPISGHVAVTYIAGYQSIPAEFTLATRIIVQHLWQTQRGNKGWPKPGGMDDSLGPAGMGFAIPNRALELLGTGSPGFA